jgi:hypothetical protein
MPEQVAKLRRNTMAQLRTGLTRRYGKPSVSYGLAEPATSLLVILAKGRETERIALPSPTTMDAHPRTECEFLAPYLREQ